MNIKGAKIAIIGGAGFGREVADIALELGYEDIVYLSTDPTEEKVMGFPLFEDNHEVVQNLQENNYGFVIGIGDTKTRKMVVEKYPELNYPNIIHPSVTFGYKQRAQLENTKGNIMAAGCRFTNNISFGDFGVFNLNSTVGHDCIIEDYVSLMANVVVSGNVKIETGVYIGSGAVIIQGNDAKKNLIEAYAFIGMGSVVLGRVKANVKVFGNPAVKI